MKRKRIALYSFLPLSIGRQLIQGVINFRTTNPQCDWEFPIISGEGINIQAIKSSKIDGIITPVRGQNSDILETMNIPVVNISAVEGLHNFPSVTFNNYEIGKLAADSLSRCGFTNHYYLCQHNSLFYSQQRYQGFNKSLAAKGFNSSIISVPASKIQNQINGVTVGSAIGKILDKINLPAAIYAENDTLGYALLNECKQYGIRVPFDLAVLGTDNDSIFCKLSTPELSSIHTNAELVGFEAATALNKLLNGEQVKKETLIGGAEVFQRDSTMISTTNKSVESALNYIRNHVNESITVNDVAANAPMSRRNLEIQFKRHTGTTIHNLIVNERISQSAKMLRETQWPLKRIAQESGFGSVNRFMSLFKKQYGITPSKYRSASKGS